MYIEQLNSLVDQLELDGKTTREMKTIISSAGKKYLDLKGSRILAQTPELEVVIDHAFIEQTEILSDFGISVTPHRWQELPKDAQIGPVDKCQTVVIFPTSLFERTDKAVALQRIRKIS